jgi:ATP-dependent DNA helicase RecG
MFGFDPQLHILQSEVVYVRYKNSLDVGGYVDRKIISGTPIELIDQAQDFLTTHMRVGAESIGFKRVDLPEYPIEALREAIVNAITHRDYSRIGEAIRIFFYADRIEVHSPGLLPPGVALEDLVVMRAPSRPRNPILAQFLRDIPGYVECIGAGIRLMVNEMQLMGLPAPEFVEQHEFVVIFRNGQQRDETTSGPFNPRQIIGLRLIQERGSITSREYCDMTGAPERTSLHELRDMVDLAECDGIYAGRFFHRTGAQRRRARSLLCSRLRAQ